MKNKHLSLEDGKQQADKELSIILNESFSGIKCEEELKEKTAAAIFESPAYKKNRIHTFIPSFLKAAGAVAIAAILIAVYGVGTYTSPAAAVSLDGTVSVKMVINRYDKVLKVDYFNENGRKVLANVRLKGSDYNDAVNDIIRYEKKKDTSDSVVYVGINSDDKAMAREIEEQVRTTDNQPGVILSLRHNSSIDEEKADRLNITCYRYSIYRYLKSEGAEISLEEIKSLSVYDLKKLLLEKRKSDKAESADIKHIKNDADPLELSEDTPGSDTETRYPEDKNSISGKDDKDEKNEKPLKPSKPGKDMTKNPRPDNTDSYINRPDTASEKNSAAENTVYPDNDPDNTVCP